ncbi:hypothetical protein OROMI_010487 [Orobanche minor]
MEGYPFTWERIFPVHKAQEVDLETVIECIDPRLNINENQELIWEFTENEAKDAIFAMHPDKSSGPDGMNPAFYQKFWNIVDKDVAQKVTSSRNTSSSAKSTVSQVLQVPVRNDSFYMGLSKFVSRNKWEVFSYIKEKIWNRLQSWKGQVISRVGKEILIKSVIQSIPSYVSSIFLLPTKLCDEKENLMNKFWWVILATKKLVCSGSVLKIGNGSSVNVWKDPWIPDSNNPRLMSPIITNMEEMKVSNLLQVDKVEWDRDLLKELFLDNDEKGLYTTSMLFQWQKAQVKQVCLNSTNEREGVLVWQKPSPDWKTCNIDAAVFERNGRSSFGCLIRDENGAFVAGYGGSLAGVLDPKITEALAFRAALSWLKNLQISQVYIELDSLIVVQAFHSKIKYSSYLGSIMSDCVSIVKDLGSYLVYFVKRPANVATHVLARKANSMFDRKEWLAVPSFLINVLIQDLQ